jgi:hypothetical protein
MQLVRLPDEYIDVTTGRFARLKRWLKAKLLHNFRVSYVDAISRQQTQFNHQVLEAIAVLAAEQGETHEAVAQPKFKRERTLPLREAS